MPNAERQEPNEPAVVFLHGLFGTPRDFEVVRALLPARYRLFAPDLPIASGAGELESVSELVGFLDRRLQSAGIDRAVFVGNSLGGHVALSFALQFPERVAGLVLSGSSGLFERGFETVPRRPERAWVASRIGEVFSDAGLVDSGLVEEVHRVLLDRRRYLSLVRLARSAKQESLRPRLGEIRCPTLLLWGTEDRITPPAVAHDFLAGLTGAPARLLFIAGCGHAPMIERPSVFAFHLGAYLNDVVPEAGRSQEVAA